MLDYVLLMHRDAPDAEAADDGKLWDEYVMRLRTTGQFDGGSAMGDGERIRKGAADEPTDYTLGGYLRVRAVSLEDAKRFLAGNPVYEAGGTVEIRELMRDQQSL